MHKVGRRGLEISGWRGGSHFDLEDLSVAKETSVWQGAFQFPQREVRSQLDGEGGRRMRSQFVCGINLLFLPNVQPRLVYHSFESLH